MLNEIRALRGDMAKIEVRRLQASLDCWHSNNRTRIESDEFKESLIAYYQCAAPPSTPLSNNIYCMITRKLYRRDLVIASHIVKHSTQGESMPLYGLSPLDIDSPRNGFLMLKSIEESFDRKEVCFIYNPIDRSLRLKVLNPLLMGKKLHSTEPMTFANVDNAALMLPVDVFPFRRCLNMHAKFSFSRALLFKWILPTAELDSYFAVSDAGLQEPVGFGDLTWQEVHGTVRGVTY